MQEAQRATSRRRRQEDWAILRALSETLGQRLPYDNLEAVRAAIVAQVPHFGTLNTVPTYAGADPAIWARWARMVRSSSTSRSVRRSPITT